MRYCAKTKGFSTIEILTAIAIVVILVSILVGVGRRIQSQAEEKLADGMIDVLVSALEQYYDTFEAFPPMVADIDSDGDIDEADFSAAVGEAVTLLSGAPQESYWTSSALYYFLNNAPSSKTVIDTLTDSLISCEDDNGDPIQIEIPADSGTIMDLTRFVDPWGNTILYTYVTDDNFPLIVSAGPDGVMGTDDDMDSR
jgi:type II secretory pathway pseudopilin PulG